MFSLALKPMALARTNVNKWLGVLLIIAASYGAMNLFITPIVYLFLLMYLGLVALTFSVNVRYLSRINLMEGSRYLYLIHLFFYAISGLFAAEFVSGVWYVISVAGFFLLFMLVFYRLSSEGHIDSLLKAVFWITLSLGILALLIRVLGIGAGLIDLSKINPDNFLLINNLAFSGLQTNQNSFGVVAAIGAMVSMYHFVQRRGTLWFFLSLASMLMFTAMVVASTSRGSMLLLAIFVVFFGSAMLRKRRVLMFAFAGLGTLAAIFVIYELHQYIAVAERLDEGASTSGRAAIWVNAYEVGMEHFWSGVGPLQYEFTGYGHSQHAHNFYVDSFAGLGFFGILSFVVFIGYVMLMSWLRFASGNVRREDKTPFLFCFCLMLAHLGHQMFEARGFLPFSHVGIVVTLSLGYLMYIINSRELE